MRVRPTTAEILGRFGDQHILTKRMWGHTLLEDHPAVTRRPGAIVKRYAPHVPTDRELVFFPGFLPPLVEFDYRSPLMLNSWHLIYFGVNLAILPGINLHNRTVDTTFEQMADNAVRLLENILNNPNIKHLAISAESLGCITALQAVLALSPKHRAKICNIILFSPKFNAASFFDPDLSTCPLEYESSPHSTANPGQFLALKKTTCSREVRSYRISQRFFDSALRRVGLGSIERLAELDQKKVELILAADDPINENANGPCERYDIYYNLPRAVTTFFDWDKHVFWGDMIYGITEGALQPITRWMARDLPPIS